MGPSAADTGRVFEGMLRSARSRASLGRGRAPPSRCSGRCNRCVVCHTCRVAPARARVSLAAPLRHQTCLGSAEQRCSSHPFKASDGFELSARPAFGAQVPRGVSQGSAGSDAPRRKAAHGAGAARSQLAPVPARHLYRRRRHHKGREGSQPREGAGKER